MDKLRQTRGKKKLSSWQQAKKLAVMIVDAGKQDEFFRLDNKQMDAQGDLFEFLDKFFDFKLKYGFSDDELAMIRNAIVGEKNDRKLRKEIRNIIEKNDKVKKHD